MRAGGKTLASIMQRGILRPKVDGKILEPNMQGHFETEGVNGRNMEFLCRDILKPKVDGLDTT